MSISHRNTVFFLVYGIPLTAFFAFYFGRLAFQEEVLDAFHFRRAKNMIQSNQWLHRKLIEEVNTPERQSEEKSEEVRNISPGEPELLLHNDSDSHKTRHFDEELSPKVMGDLELVHRLRDVVRRNKARQQRRINRPHVIEATLEHGATFLDKDQVQRQIETSVAVATTDQNNEQIKAKCESMQLTQIGNTCATYPDYLNMAIPIDAQRIPIYPHKIQYLGVLLDAGRHWFPIPWIKNLLDALHLMNFNLLQFRLTDDQAFNVRFDSHPELATAASNAPDNTTVYTADELRDLVNYANERNITIMPEINVPGHAGGWAGSIPYLVVPCAKFICAHGYGIPLNMTHVGLYDMLRDIINETRSIFHTSPYLHLGGDELHMGETCFSELGLPMDDYTYFEERLRGVVSSLGIDEEYIVRWETTGHPLVARVGKVVHWWESLRFHESSHNWTKPHVFVSKGLYFDTNVMENAFTLFQATERVTRHRKTPIAMVAGTFELGPSDWKDRNVLGRLLAVAIGASELQFEEQEKGLFDAKYEELCRMLKFPDLQCALHGVPPVPWDHWRNILWLQFTNKWKNNICNALTTKKTLYEHVDVTYQAHAMILPGVVTNFWDHFGEEIAMEIAPIQYPVINGLVEIESIRTKTVPLAGIILDVTRSNIFATITRLDMIKFVIDDLVLLGFNMLQLRFMDDAVFVLGFDPHPGLANVPIGEVYDTATLKEIQMYATQRGIIVMPEISVSTRAGGWFSAGYNTPCPKLICNFEEFVALSVNINEPKFLAVLSSVLYELKEIFGTGYLHLGFNDREESMSCFDEAGIKPDFDSFEAKLELILEFHGYDPKKVVRWEEQSIQDRGTRRAGKITHYRETIGSSGNGESHFSSTGLMLEKLQSEFEDGYSIYQQVQNVVASSPMAVLAWAGPFHHWQFFSIRERLLAVAIGLSKPSLNSEEFSNIFEVTCVTLQTKGPMRCSMLGKIHPSRGYELQIAKELIDRRDQMCTSRAHKAIVEVPKSGVLVPKVDESGIVKNKKRITSPYRVNGTFV